MMQPSATSETQKPASLLRRLAASGAWAAVGRLGSVGAFFLINLQLARILSIRDFGEYVLLTSLSTLASVVVLMGLPEVVLRVLRESPPHESWPRVNAVIRRSLLLVCAAIAILFGLYLAATFILPTQWFRLDLSTYAVVIGSWICVMALGQILAEVFRGFDRFGWSAMLGGQSGSLLGNLLMVAVVWVGSWRHDFQLQEILWLQLGCLALPLLIALLGLRSLRGSIKTHASTVADTTSRQTQTPTSYRWLMRESLPVLTTHLLATMIAQLDLLILGHYGSDEALAVYGAVKRLAILIGAPLIVANLAVRPFIAELYHAGRIDQLQRLLQGTSTLLAIPTLLVLSLFIAAPSQVLTYLYGANFAAGAPYLVLLSLAYTVFVMTGSNGITLIMTGHQRVAMTIALATAIVNIPLCLLLTANYGAWGAALATTTIVIANNLASTFLLRYQVGVWACCSFSPQMLHNLWQLPRQLAGRSPAWKRTSP